MKDVEIEIQAQVEHAAPLIEFLQKEAQFQSEKDQHDEYFSPTHHDFLSVTPVKEWPRLRKTGNTSSINYKNWHYNAEGKSHHCDEYETNIENVETVKKILEALQMKSIALVDKKRRTWVYNKYEIALDDVKNLGNFVEIEYKGENEEGRTSEEIAKEMLAFLKEKGCGRIELNYKGYPHMMLFGKEKNPEIH